jgi:hypothetical protein
MIGTSKNPSAINGVIIPPFERYRQYYLSLDADIKRFDYNNTSSQLLLTVPRLLKLPFPAVEYSPAQRSKLHWIYF